GAVIAQPVIYAAGLAALGLETLAIASSLAFAVVVVAASMAIPNLFDYHASILTESLFMSGLIFFLAATTPFVRQPSPAAAALASAIAGLTATVRTTAYALLPGLVTMVLIEWRRLPGSRRRVLAAAVLPIIAIPAAERLAARTIHGEALTTLLGRHLFAKAGLIEVPAMPASPDPLRARLDAVLEHEYAPIRRLIEAAPDEIRATLTLYYEGCLQSRCVALLRTSIGLPDPRIDEAMSAAGLARIAAAPVSFARLTATHYRSLWTIYKLRHPDR